MTLNNILDREPIKVSPILYPWTSLNEIYYKQILPDSFFYDVVEQSTSEYKLGAFVKLFKSHKSSISKISGIDVSLLTDNVNMFDMYERDKNERRNLINWLKTFVSLTKLLAYDSLFVILSEHEPSQLEPNELHEKFYHQEIWQPVEPTILVNCRRAIKYLIDSHNSRSSSSNDGVYRIDEIDEGVMFVKILIKAIIKEHIRNILFYQPLTGFRPPITINEAIAPIIDVELAMITGDDREPTEEDGELVLVRVNHLLQIFGSPRIRNLERFVKQITDLAVGSKKIEFGMIKSPITGYGSPTSDKVSSKKIYRASNRDKMLAGNAIGKRLVQKKSEEGLLKEKRRETQEFAAGGDVYFLVDCTGSTIGTDGNIGVINLEEAILSMAANICRASDRKLHVYFYNEGTSRIETLDPSLPEKTFKLKKLNLYGNSAPRRNDEIASFSEVFHEINTLGRTKQHSLIFMSDGGMLNSGASTQSHQLRLMIENTPNVDVLPILIASDIDYEFSQVFVDRAFIHIQNPADFDSEHLKQIIHLCQKQED